MDETPDREFGLRECLPKQDVGLGQAVTVQYELTAPAEAGDFDVYFDIVEEGFTWFARQGSPTPACRLRVGTVASMPAAAD
jgi:hypothetical protein